eukprot:SAG22_NODE_79_length_21845_cov_17.798538_5_plen_66_part_00
MYRTRKPLHDKVLLACATNLRKDVLARARYPVRYLYKSYTDISLRWATAWGTPPYTAMHPIMGIV